ncbi:MAG: MogA/MoaB family molybdenum cofactor biosynthesis protein [Deltaproteobacteria bacterium]|nr:MogA/MoaB family molybdenum cofactor biosynthesis protein [Deltaproteobacteria bacterium]
MRVGILTISDRSSRGERKDQSGPALAQFLSSHETEVVCTAVCSDNKSDISAILRTWADEKGVDLILTTGGTGLSPRDVTPEATLSVISRTIPGMAEAMRAASMDKTPHAMLSRAVAGVRGKTLIINLPGSPRGALENLETIMPALEHAVKKIQGDMSDCA